MLYLAKTPTPIQRKYLACPADEILYSGSIGSGKSTAAVMDAYIECMKYPGLVVGMFRRTLPELRATLIREALETYPKSTYKYLSAIRLLRFKNGSEIRFNFIDTDSDLTQYQGQEFDMIILDEACNFTEYQLQRIKERVRTSKPNLRTKIRYLSNPIGVGKAYLKQRFIDNKKPFVMYATEETKHLPEDQRKYQCYIPAKTTDNPHLLKADPAYLDSLNSLPDEIRKAMVDGDWESQVGTFFPQFSKKLHVIEEYTPKHTDDLFISVDWGTARPFAVGWYALTENNKFIMYREYYGWTGKPNEGINLTVNQFCERLLKLCPENETYKYLVLDSACWSKQGHAESIYETMQRLLKPRGIHIIQCRKDRVHNWENMKRWMEVNPINKQPDLLFTKNCRNLIRTLPNMVYMTTGANAFKDMDSKLEDHLCDQVAYLLSTRPRKEKMADNAFLPNQWGYYIKDKERLPIA